MQFNLRLKHRIKKESTMMWLQFVDELLYTNEDNSLVLKDCYSEYMLKKEKKDMDRCWGKQIEIKNLHQPSKKMSNNHKSLPGHYEISRPFKKSIVIINHLKSSFFFSFDFF